MNKEEYFLDISKINKKFAFAGAISMMTLPWLWHFARAPRAPSVEVFFRENKHLHAPVPKLIAEKEPERIPEKFNDTDYHLTPGSWFLISFKTSIDGEASKNESETSKSLDGWVEVHSIKWAQSSLLVLCRFQSGKKFSHSTDPKSYLLLKLNPTGGLVSIAGTQVKPTEPMMSQTVRAIQQIFKPLPVKKEGKFTRNELDLRLQAFPVDYVVKDVSGDIRNITGQINASSSTKMAAFNEGEARAMLAQVMQAQVDIKINAEWLKQEGIPKTLSQKYGFKLSLGSETLIQINSESTSGWEIKGRSPFSSVDLSKYAFNYPLEPYFSIPASNLKSAKGKNKNTGPLAARSLSEILDSTKKHLDENQEKAIMLEMSDYLKDHPNQAGVFAQRAVNASGQERSMLIGSLGYLGSPDAQDALVTVYNAGRLPLATKEQVMVNLAASSEPLTKQTKSFLQSELTDSHSSLRMTAGLALGNSIAHDGDPETINSLHDLWQKSDRLKDDHKVTEQSFILKAMGNSRSNAFISEVKDGLNSDEPTVRSSALDSLRFVTDQSSRDLLFSKIAQEPDAGVRAVGYNSLDYQPFDDRTSTVLQNCASSESNTGCRVECIKVLLEHMNNPTVASFIQARRSTEKDPQVKAILNGSIPN